MIECYNLPTAIKINGEYFAFINKIKGSAESLSNIVLLEEAGLMDNNRVGIKYYMQISKNIRNQKPKINDIVNLNSVDYRIDTVVDRTSNLGILPFWECEVNKLSTN